MPSPLKAADLPKSGDPPPFSAPGLVLGLLFLSTPAMGVCLDKYQELFGQLQKQTDIMQRTSLLLDPYVSAWPLWHPSLREQQA